ncbi:NfeD family protein, partial [Escherichia coli]|nr:NfeD family protein [Escherichia coli]
GEVLGTGGYLLWWWIAAVGVAIIVCMLRFLSGEWQGIYCAMSTILSGVVWRIWLSVRKNSQADEVNQKSHQLIGTKVRLISDTDEGFSRARLADGSWRTYSERPLKAGTEVIITSVDGITLHVKPYHDGNNPETSDQ